MGKIKLLTELRKRLPVEKALSIIDECQHSCNGIYEDENVIVIMVETKAGDLPYDFDFEWKKSYFDMIKF